MTNNKPSFSLKIFHEKMNTPIDLLSLSSVFKNTLPEFERFLLESIGGPKVDTKQSILALGILFCIEVTDDVIGVSGETEVVNIIQEQLQLRNNNVGSLGAIKFIRTVEDLFTVVWPDGFLGKLPLLTVIGYDALGHKPPGNIKTSMPQLAVVLPKFLIIIDHVDNTCSVIDIVGKKNSQEFESIIDILLENIQNINETPSPTLETVNNFPIHMTVSVDQYIKDVLDCKEHILQGDIYQIQIGHEVLVKTSESAYTLYKRLRQLNPSPYMFFIPLPSVTLAGASPELFIRVDARKIQMRPLAGTLPKTNKSTSHILSSDPKEQAEHIMLVDLCRNDIGRVAKIGSVKVPQLVFAEEFSTVFHLVSTITGVLRDGLDIWDAIDACSPAGTMTGTPKIRAMQIIAEHEWTNRGLYSGLIAFSDGRGNLVSALIIRTLIVQDGWVSARASAGIVADSNPDKEWIETLVKIKSSLASVTSEQM